MTQPVGVPGRRSFAGGAAALLAALPLQPGAAAARSLGLTASLRAGRPLLVVVAPPDRTLSPENEAPGDWHAYLEDGVRERPSGVSVVRASRAAYRQEIAAPAVRSAFAALFLRGDRTALLYDGMVLEPQIYDLGFGFLAGTPLPAEGPSYGLVPARVRLR